MQGSFRLGDWLIQPSLGRVSKNGETVHVRAKVMDLLVFLAQHPGEVVSKDRILDAVWGTDALSESALSRSMTELRKTFNDDAEQPSLIETIPKRGYRLIGPVTQLTVPVSTAAMPPSDTGFGSPCRREPDLDQSLLSAERLRRREVRWLLRPVGIALAMVVVSIGLWLVGGRWFAAARPATEPDRGSPAFSSGVERPSVGRHVRSLAILPFINLKPDADTDFLSFSLADAVIARLATIRALDVRASYTVYKYRSQTPAPRKAAQDLDVSLVMTGSFLKEGSVLRVTPQLVDVASNETLYQESFDVQYSRLLAVQERVAAQVLSSLHVSLSSHEQDSWDSSQPRNPLAYEFFLRGRDSYEAARYTHGIEFFEKSVALDPRFARAWAFLGSAYALNASLRLGGREQYDKALEAYEKAIAIDATDPSPRVYRAEILIETGRVEEAVPLLRDLVQQHSRDPQAFWTLAYAYRYAGMLEESVVARERAGAIDPLFLARKGVFLTYLYQGAYEKFFRSYMADDRSAYQVFYAGFARYHLKDYAQASRDFDRAYELDSSLLQARVGKVLSHVIKGQRAAAMQLLLTTEREIDAREVGDAEGIYKLAQGYAALHDAPATLRLLRKSIEGGFFCYPYFRSDPLLENVRREREYESLLEQARQRHERFKRRFF